MHYIDARKEVTENGKEARREAWSHDQKIRLSNSGDYDYINYDNLDGAIVSECPSKKCDCIICLYHATPEDQQAEDWVILN